MSLNDIYKQRYAQTERDRALRRLDRELGKQIRKCRSIYKHRVQDWERRHLIWKHNPTFEEPKKPSLDTLLYMEPMTLTVGIVRDLRCLLS